MSTPESEPRAIIAAVREALAGGDLSAVARLRPLVRRGDLDPLSAHRAGRLLARAHAERDCGMRVLIAGRCTVTWLVSALVSAAWADGEALAVDGGGFDTVVQDLEQAVRAAAPVDVAVLIAWPRDPFGDTPEDEEAWIENELAMWRQAWRLAGERLGARVVQVGLDWITPGPEGYLQGEASGHPALVRRLNDTLRAALADSLPTSSTFVDVSLVSGDLGRRRFYDPRRWFWTRQPWSEDGAWLLARHLWAAVRAVSHGPKKLLVLDLDNTLWGGVVGEVGGLGVELGDSPAGEAYRAFQRHCRALSRRGVVLAVVSKNNDADARAPFCEHPDMVLQLDDFAAFEASWSPKDQMIRAMAERLRLGLEHVVFFDDNPAERALVRHALPAVQVVEVPDDPGRVYSGPRIRAVLRAGVDHRRGPRPRRRLPGRAEAALVARGGDREHRSGVASRVPAFFGHGR